MHFQWAHIWTFCWKQMRVSGRDRISSLSTHACRVCVWDAMEGLLCVPLIANLSWIIDDSSINLVSGVLQIDWQLYLGLLRIFSKPSLDLFRNVKNALQDFGKLQGFPFTPPLSTPCVSINTQFDRNKLNNSIHVNVKNNTHRSGDSRSNGDFNRI